MCDCGWFSAMYYSKSLSCCYFSRACSYKKLRGVGSSDEKVVLSSQVLASVDCPPPTLAAVRPTTVTPASISTVDLAHDADEQQVVVTAMEGVGGRAVRDSNQSGMAGDDISKKRKSCASPPEEEDELAA